MSAHTAANTEHPRSDVQIAAEWARGLGRTFRRVALFRVNGTTANVASVVGMGPPPLGTGLSLLEETPLRWAIAAASPIIGAGEAPGGSLIARKLGLSPPRAYAVIPLVTHGKMAALAYVDQASEPLPLTAASELFSFCSKILATDRAQPPPAPLRGRISSTAARPHNRRFRPLPLLRPPQNDDREPVRQTANLVGTDEQLDFFPEQYADDPTVVTPDTALCAGAEQPRPWRLQRGQRIAFGSALLFAAALIAWPFSPVGGDSTQWVQIPPEASVAQIAAQLEDSGAIRSAAAFRLLARVTGVDRSLRAGAYKLPEGGWAWTVLSVLHQGQVEMKSVTIPEGLSLVEMARLLEKEGLAPATDLLRAAYDPELLERFGIPARNLEGFLFPETYTLARGLTATEILTVMVTELFERVRELPDAANLSNQELFERLTLASLVEREARDVTEQPRIAGVFKNRLERNMRLESCATVQYILGKPKDRLTYEDVRRPSPYNTYLNTGLPPGPIANPGLDAIQAALAPEAHDYLFFLAREDGSHKHVFSKTYATHKERQRRLRSQ